MRTHLTNHLETHAVTNEFQCTFCDMSLKTSKTLRSHILQMHSNDHPYKCFYCNKGFMNKFKWRVSLLSVLEYNFLLQILLSFLFTASHAKCTFGSARHRS